MPEIPPWLTRNYDPVDTYVRSFQTGAQIGEAQSRLQEEQRQANMRQIAAREALQANILRAQTELEVEKSYHDQQLALRQQELKQHQAQNEAMGQRAEAAMKQRALFEMMRLQKPPASVQEVDEILKGEQQAKQAEDMGDMEAAQKFRDRSALLREQMKGQQVVTGYDDQGRPIVTVGKGIGAGPTMATASKAQQKLQKYENATELMNKLQKNLQAGHVGAAGVAGEYLWDKGLVQLANLMGDESVKASEGRVTSRAGLTMLRESLMREISDDNRFSNQDREEISKALPSSGIFESLSDAQQRLGFVRNILSARSKVYSQSIGKKPPIWSMSPDEIKAEYKAGRIDRKDALDALERFN